MGVLWLIQCCLWELKSAKALRNPSLSTGGSKGWMRASWCQDSHVGHAPGRPGTPSRPRRGAGGPLRFQGSQLSMGSYRFGEES